MGNDNYNLIAAGPSNPPQQHQPPPPQYQQYQQPPQYVVPQPYYAAQPGPGYYHQQQVTYVQQPMMYAYPNQGLVMYQQYGRSIGDSSDTAMGAVLSFCFGFWGYLALACSTTSHRFILGLHIGNSILCFVLAMILLAVGIPIADGDSFATTLFSIVGTFFVLLSVMFGLLANHKGRKISEAIAQNAALNGGVPQGVQAIFF